MYTMDRHRCWTICLSLFVGDIYISCSDVDVLEDIATISGGRSATEKYTVMGEVRRWGMVSNDGHICAVQ